MKTLGIGILLLSIASIASASEAGARTLAPGIGALFSDTRTTAQSPSKSPVQPPRRTTSTIASASSHFNRLDRMVHPIETVTKFQDGVTVRGLGSGFVVGPRYFTAHHNLVHPNEDGVSVSVSYLGGEPVSPSVAYPEFDLAVIDLSDSLCDRYCNQLRLNERPSIAKNHSVVWLRKVGSELVMKKARVLSYAILGQLDKTADTRTNFGCAQNLVVKIDAPFVPGSSGAPVLDAQTGDILGIIQGSVLGDGDANGFFKPIECVVELFGA